MGLANRVVPKGRARAEAEALAREIARFPQICMRADRRSAYEQWDLPYDAALANEYRRGMRGDRLRRDARRRLALRGRSRAGGRRFDDHRWGPRVAKRPSQPR